MTQENVTHETPEPLTRLQIAFAACLLPAQIFLFNVMTVATGNEEYVGSSLLEIIQLSAIPFIALTLGLYLLARYLTPRDQRIFTFALISLFLLTWLQSQVLVWNYGGLTGESIAWGEFNWQGFVDIAAWIGIAAILIIFYKKIQSAIRNLAMAIFALQILIIGFSAVPQLIAGSTERDAEAGIDQIAAFSTDHNIIHIVIDGYQSDILEELLQYDSFGNRYREHFTGFTFYRENLGVFPYTQFSVPAYFTTQTYNNHQQKEAFIDTALSGKSIMSVARDNDYDIDIAMSGPYFISRHSNLPHDHMVDLDNAVTPQDQFTDSALLWDIAIFRAVPHFLKKHVYNDQKWLISRAMVADPAFSYKYFIHTAFMNLVTESMNVSREAPVYKLIHIHNTHRPMVVDDRCEFAGRILSDTRLTLTIQTACTMETVINFIDQLQELGIYDNSLIIIHGDHGGWVPTLRSDARIPIENQEAPFWAMSLASPLLMVKPPNAQNELRVSDALSSLIDIPDTISDIMKWDTSFGQHSALTLEGQEDRERRFFFYFWDRNEWSNDFTNPILEYSIIGSHYENDWVPIKVHASEVGLTIQ
jgi:hypothetical protein